MIEAERLTKDYGTVVALQGVSFRVARGEVVGFLGPNGAGKTTALRILAGFIGQSSGEVKVNGFNVQSQPLEARRSVGYMPEAAPLYPELRVQEYLGFRAHIKGVARKARAAAIDRAAERAGVSEMRDTVIGHLSKGYRQRVALADALLSRPPLLILDEPTAGLDPNQVRQVRQLIRELGETHTILLSTHILSEVESTCDRALVIHRGKIVADASVDELKQRRERAALVVRGNIEQALAVLRSQTSVKTSEAAELGDGLSRIVVDFDEAGGGVGPALEQIVGSLVLAGISIREVTPDKASLEEVFAELTAGGEESTP